MSKKQTFHLNHYPWIKTLELILSAYFFTKKFLKNIFIASEMSFDVISVIVSNEILLGNKEHILSSPTYQKILVSCFWNDRYQKAPDAGGWKRFRRANVLEEQRKWEK